MIKQLYKVVMFNTVMLTIFDWGGVNVVYAANQGVYRGNFAVIEVDEDSPMTAIPDTGTWYNGPLDTNPQQYDVLVAARGNIDTRRTEVNLTVTPAKTPDFFTTQDGKIVVAEPQIFGTVTMPMGRASFIRISLTKINNNAVGNMSTIDKHVCLGFRKQGETDFIDILHAGKMEGGYEVLKGGEVMELVPLLSKTNTARLEEDEDYNYVDRYTPVKPGDPIEFDFALDTKFDFGSVFRVSVVADSREWIINQPCYLYDGIAAEAWYNFGSLGVGKIPGYDGDRLLAISRQGDLAHSGDGIHWVRDMGNIGIEGSYEMGPKYGNGVWCIVPGIFGKGIVRGSGTDGGWSALNDKDPYSQETISTLAFGDGKFIIEGANNGISISLDAVHWEKWINPPDSASGVLNYGFLIYGDGRWLAGIPYEGFNLYLLEEGKDTWEVIPYENLKLDGEKFSLYSFGPPQLDLSYACCYAEGYFYMVGHTGYSDTTVVRSSDGKNWFTIYKKEEPMTIYNITYFKGKLYALGRGLEYSIGIPQP